MSLVQDSENRSPAYSNTEARVAFRQAVLGGSMIVTKHARARMRECGLDNTDLLQLSRQGAVVTPPEPDIKTGDWVYRIETQHVIAAFVIIPQRKVRLVTCFTPES